MPRCLFLCVRILPLLLIFCLPCHQALAKDAQKLRVTLLLEHDGPSTYTRLLKSGLERASRDFGLRPSVVIEGDEDKQEAVFQREAAKADLILIASDRFHEILRDNARRFPNVYFGCIDAGIRGANITCITFADEQAAFLAGAAAALFTKNFTQKKVSSEHEQTIAWLSGEDIPAMRSMFNGFREGALLSVPGIRVIHGVAGSFAAPEAAAVECRRLIKEGATLLVLAAGAGNEAALKEAKASGIDVIGLDCDQKDSYPGHVLLSILKDIDGAVYSIIKDTVHMAFKGKEIETYDLTHGVGITDPRKSLGRNQGLDTLARRLTELTHELITGGITLKSLRQRTLCNCL